MLCPPPKNTHPQNPQQNPTSTPDENLGKEMLNLGTHARICSWSHPYSQVNSKGESSHRSSSQGSPARLRLAQSALPNRSDAELQEDPAAPTAVLQVSYLMWNECCCLDALDLSLHT